MADLADINNYFATRKNQFHKNMYHRAWRTNPHIALHPRGDYDLDEGRIPQVITSTHELPTAYPFGLSKLALSNGTGNGACNTPATVIKSGSKTRNFEIEVAAFETEILCLTDLQFSHQATQQVKNKERGLKEFSTVWMADWFRVHNIGMIDKKFSTNSVDGFSTKSDALYDFTTLALPTHEFNWIHADIIYDMLVRIGAEEYAVGQAMGEPVFSMSIGPGYKRELFQNDELIRETVNYGKALENFRARGITQAINGWLPNVDLFPIRYKVVDNVLTPIYPTINADTSTGRESKPNPDYMTVAKGGQALYEVITLEARGVYEVKARPLGPTSFSKAGLNAVNYAGEVNWINNKDMDKNKLGNMGFYRIDIQQAAKPVFPELGISVLTLAKD